MSPKKYKNQLAHNVRSGSFKNVLKWKEFLDEFVLKFSEIQYSRVDIQ